jgi:hypothetical protein
VSGYVQLSAHQYHAFYTPKKNRKGSDQIVSGTGTAKNGDTPVVISSFSHQKQNEILDIPFFENEVEEDESSSLKKYVNVSSVFSDRSLAHFFSDLKKISPRYISKVLSNRYIILQVFRI